MTRVLDLSDHHLNILRQVFAPYRQRVGPIAVFGSRVIGRSRPNSDIDLVLYGEISDRDYAYISADLEDSLLPVTVDLVVYDSIAHSPLREHIDRVALPLPLDPALDEGKSVAAE